MNIEKLRKMINSDMFELLSQQGQMFGIIDFMIDELEGSITPLILAADEANKQKAKEKDNLQYMALDSAVGLISGLKREMDKAKGTPKKLRNYFDFHFDVIMAMTPIAKTLFPDGKIVQASQNQEEFFIRFKESVMKNKESIIGGGSEDWAKRMGFYEYFMKVIEENKVTK